MKKFSKRVKLNKKEIIKSFYNIDEALDLLNKVSNAKFIETAEIHINVNTQAAQIRNSLTLPHGTGNKIKIAVLVPDNLIESVLKNEVCLVGNENLIQQIQKNIINFDVLITIPEMMPKLAKLGKILGPKGLMPSPKSGTVTENLFETLLQFKKGKFEYKTDKTNIFHIPFGKLSFEKKQLKENLIFLYETIKQDRPAGLKGLFIKSIYICSTMGPSIPIDLKSFN
jgi:large subunit ribosomal protein L1